MSNPPEIAVEWKLAVVTILGSFQLCRHLCEGREFGRSSAASILCWHVKSESWLGLLYVSVAYIAAWRHSGLEIVERTKLGVAGVAASN